FGKVTDDDCRRDTHHLLIRHASSPSLAPAAGAVCSVSSVKASAYARRRPRSASVSVVRRAPARAPRRPRSQQERLRQRYAPRPGERRLPSSGRTSPSGDRTRRTNEGWSPVRRQATHVRWGSRRTRPLVVVLVAVLIVVIQEVVAVQRRLDLILVEVVQVEP